MTVKSVIEDDINRLNKEIKDLVKLLVDTYDPQDLFTDDLVAECSASRARLKHIKRRLLSDTPDEYVSVLDDELAHCFVVFGQIIGMPAVFIASQYRSYIQKEL